MVVRRLVRLLSVIVLLAAAALFGPSARLAPASAAALPLSSCTASANVILAVDFGHWGGPVLRSCGSTPTTGYTLLNQGGWSSAGTQHDGPAFICRIGYSGYAGGQQYPTAAEDRCVVTPPTSAYWSYWHAAPNSNTWTYSQSGAQSYSPAPGSIDLWTFGATDTAGSSGAPAYSPNSLRETGGVPVGGGSSGPPAGSGGSGSGSGTGSGSGSSGSGSSGSGSSGSGSSGAGAGSGSGGSGSGSGSEAGAAVGAGSSGGGSHSSAASTTSSAPASTSSTARSTASTATKAASPSRRSSPTSFSSASTQPTVVDARPAAAVRHTGGSFAPALGGVVIVLVLAGLAGLQVWRRRRAGAGQ